MNKQVLFLFARGKSPLFVLIMWCYVNFNAQLKLQYR
jgi:hypothetical protein